ncbi:MAG: cysteine desulfurase NifS [Candidatus Niyogibacteria bacterium CG10_big_fil_rev_8_21_14_0_10_46_36]|uniref:cysteine desulfurase n=1 Tax=Candidatus Niyogibacteria bacterium CG10_big_fil_rev_8_21_14_0_10_46_36 TaxID=1974726 RepID=A0A2H0TFC6_9BACT|nr:MAG: cysteine desulfurase NifS [Candidatus Niyogibacteria bacterium CG10_big_fil_rev_8_21_14_0_10_46_36]
MSQEKLVYLDYAATTPVDPEVIHAMEPYWAENFGNPGSVHKHGQAAVKAVDNARERVKECIGAHALREVIFTGSATEANNLAIQGVISRFAFRDGKKVHVITSTIEHPSILEPYKYAEAKGLADVTFVRPDSEGRIAPEDIKKEFRPDTVLVSVGYANNEIGVVQPISEIAKIVKEFRGPKKTPYIHTDAVQAVQFLDTHVERLGVDLMTMSAHKIYGPKGVGALYIRDGVSLQPLMYGGNQEYGIRPATENVSLIAGFAEAMRLAHKQKEEDIFKRVQKLRDDIFPKIQNIAPLAQWNGTREHCLPNIINVSFPRESGELLLIGLSERGVCVSSGSACRARAQEPSYVLQELGKTKEEARSSIRISLGKYSTKNDVDMFVDALSALLHNRK